MREEPVVLEHETDRASRGLDEGALVRVVEDGAGERDAAGRERGEAGHRAEQRGLAGSVRPQQAENLTGRRGQADLEREAAPLDLGVDDQAAAVLVRHRSHRGEPRSQRSRKETRTATDTNSSTRLRAIAASGSFSRA